MGIRIDWQGTQEIPRDYDDDYLELIRLLTEAAGIEHSLMLAYPVSYTHLTLPTNREV